MNLNTLATPSLVLDLERVRRNAARMSDRARALGVRLRPHVKTHKCVEIARIQTEGHGGVITVSTLAEARAFARHGFTDITYAVPIEPGKYPAALDLIGEGVRLGVITDDVNVPAGLDAAAGSRGVAVDVYLKVDCGYHRCGVEPGDPRALDIPRRIAAASHLRFAGVLTHAGHAYHARSRDERLAIARQERDAVVACAERLRREGLAVPVVSVGSTPTATIVDRLDGVSELRPGNYVLFDGFQATLGSCEWEDCALTVLAAVIHRDRGRRQLILDVGAIALSKDAGPTHLDAGCGYGRVQDLNGRDLGARVVSLSQEHGIVQGTDGTLERLPVGARVRVVANHSCLTAAQHEWFHVLDGDRVVDRWAIHRGWTATAS